MARVNSLLSIVVEQGANELRLGSDLEPKMLAYGVPSKLSLPKMTAETVRELLGEILTPEADAAAREGGRVELMYDAGTLGSFSVTLSQQPDGGLAAVFVRARKRANAVAHAPVASPEAAPPPRTLTLLSPSSSEPSAAFEALVARAAAMQASDIHLADGQRAFVRVHGALHPLGDAPLVEDVVGCGAEGVDGAIEMAFDVPRVGRVRVHAYVTADGLAAAIRLLPPTAPAFETLNMPVAFDDVVHYPHGLVLVCGATGSGKSTTLAALAQRAIRTRSVVLVTLEDPIEYALECSESSLVRRRQLGRDVANFSSGLRDALREDPDVLLVGEMRDAETIALAMTAAETGHLVFASIHSRGAASAIERIVDAYGTEQRNQIRVQLAESLRAVIGQRLVPRARGSGRLPVVEVLRVNHAVGALIREGRTAQIASAIQSGRREGMISLERCLADRVAAGEITLEAAHAAANDTESLTAYLTKR